MTTATHKVQVLFRRLISNNNLSDNKPPLHPLSSLAPRILTNTKDLKLIKPSIDRLTEAIDSRGITNVALTGNYGSGKSTIIRTFFYHRPDIKHLKISLASFNTKAENDEELERKLEISILQQLFYHAHPSRIPDSRFKRIINLTNTRLALISIGTAVWLMSTFALFSFNYLEKLNPATWSFSKSFDFWACIFGVCFFTGIGLLSKSTARLLANSKINKFTIKGELELGENIDKSVFNQHLEEIIYFFERTSYTVIVIEDLDRFKNTAIFTKLREINIILNNSESIGRETTFVYAIRDEVFTDKNDRVKFFDYIIPVIPFINPSNAGEQLTQLVRNAGMEGVLSKAFIEDIITFIDDIDMRLLINIFHEYRIYKDSLDANLNQDELFAVTLYKNLYPDDFGDLLKRRGKLYGFISNKARYVSQLTLQLKAQIVQLEGKLNDINQEWVRNIKELRTLYIHGFLEKYPAALAFNINGETATFTEVLEDGFFTFFHNDPKITYLEHTDDVYSLKIKEKSVINPFNEIENIINSNFSYQERESFIKTRNGEGIEELLKEKMEYQRKLLDQQSWSMKTIFNEIDITPYLEDFINNDLVRNLLVNGYLNEQYSDYISLFHDVNLTREDFQFERKIRSGTPLPFNYKLEKVENLATKIRFEYFQRDVIYNNDLLDYLIWHEKLVPNKLGAFMSQLSNEKERSIEFIINFIANGENNERFISLLCEAWNGYWAYIKKNFPDEEVKQYLLLLIKHARLQDIKKLTEKDSLVHYIEGYRSFVYDFRNVNTSKVEKVLKALNIKFEVLGYIDKNIRHLPEIYENNNYHISLSNINNIITAFGTYNSKKLIPPTYTRILRSGCSQLIDYVNNNITKYVLGVYPDLPEIVSEDANVLVKLLNNSVLTNDQKLLVLKKQKESVIDITPIVDKSVYPLLFENNKIKANWTNVLHYYSTLSKKNTDPTKDEQSSNKSTIISAFSNELITFFNIRENHLALSSKELKSTTEPNIINRLIEDLLFCFELSSESYSNLIQSIPITLDKLDLPLENLDRERIVAIINAHLLTLNVQNYQLLRELFEGLHIQLAEQQPDKFSLVLSEFSLNEADVLHYLKSNKLTLNQKQDVIRNMESVLFRSAVLIDRLCQFWPEKVKPDLSPEDLKTLISGAALTELKVRMINLYSSELTDLELKTLITSLKGKYPELFQKQHKPVFDGTEQHQILFNELQKRGLIKRFTQAAKTNNKLRVIAKY